MISGVVPQLAGVTALLVRPDGYVHWVSTSPSPSPDDARGAVADWLTDVATTDSPTA
ncbi:hypothetical protein AB0M95_27715 [Sphaerisporangium sp. NPDC051017]|uniref:aromatic-ring hydroxylase C-terminal domain-containing protein n=1 Tax=Sphaerisporangium sp. NPDC051017 TaxID=3154636 RepID=UPI003429A605